MTHDEGTEKAKELQEGYQEIVMCLLVATPPTKSTRSVEHEWSMATPSRRGDGNTS